MRKLLLIIFLGLVLRLINLNQSLWLDEAITAIAVKTNSFSQLLTQFSIGDFHPPLYYLVLKFWTNIFGYNEIVLRIPSVIFGVATIYFVYRVGEKLFSKQTGLVAALILATNPLAVYYSQDARMYSLAAMAISASVWFFIQKKWLLFWLFFWIATMSDYLPLFMLPVFFFMEENKKVFIKTFILYLLATLLWLPFLYRQLVSGLQLAVELPLWNKVVGGFSWKALPLTFVKFIFGRISITNKIIYGSVAGGISLLYVWILSKSKNKFLWFWLLFPLGLGFILSAKISVFSYFRFLFVLPAFILLLAEGLKKSRILLGVVLLIQFVSLVYFNLNPTFWRENWWGAVKYMETPKSLAIMPSLAQSAPLAYYGFTTPLQDKPQLSQKYSTIYLIRYVQEIFDPQNLQLKAVEDAGYKFTENANFNGVVVWKYESRN